MKRHIALLCAAGFLGGCGSSPTTKVSTTAKPAEPVTGLHALYQLYPNARTWAGDVEVFSVRSIAVEGVKPQPGKVGAWQIVFVSPGNQQSRTDTFSVADLSISLRSGVNAGKPEGWSGSRGSQQPFRIQAAKFDSDQAYEVALKKAGDYPAKHPDIPISYELAQTASYSNAAWRVIWGQSAAASSFSILVDASTGAYVETLH